MKLIIVATCLFVVTNAQYGRGRGYGHGRGYGQRGYHEGYGYGSYGGYGGPGGPGYGHPGLAPAGPLVPPHPHPGYGYEHPRYYPRDEHDCKDKEEVPVDPGVYDDYDHGQPGYYPRPPGGFRGRPGTGNRGHGAGNRGHGAGNRGHGGGNRRRVKPAVRPAVGDNDKEPIATDDRTTGAFQLDARKKVNNDPNEVSGLTGSDTEPIKDIFLGGVDDKAVAAQDPRSVWGDGD